ncbi:MAG: signal peptidase I [Omnitrophica bacterium RIFCSPLOWO2_02_FULL_45_16]|nr:MAG: signal peptidase I [Omnitrophica bacterium RIFCSPHIGHO2_02_FULL_46_20]OGW92528.1 MAG: signal peptidase I [Omnitrophica bacterium RIFCSPLOWO2_12_FULL_45_13]OGX00318.1 MAG: signal peptidase I [Omnitrophica bacterium RIFCSPLOWO2_02_FULL_45_16]
MIRDKIRSEIREWAESIIIALILALIIRAFFVQAFKIPSGSMIPTFEIGDRIFVNKLVYGARIPFTNVRLPALKAPQRGDVIIFVSPETPTKDFVKRLIAFEGETVEIKDGNIYINGRALNGSIPIQSKYYYNQGNYGKEGEPTTVPKGSYYALGDNSANSRDSRYWGFIPKKNLIGRAVFVYWPLQRMRIIK